MDEKTEQKLSEIEASDQQAEEGSENTEKDHSEQHPNDAEGETEDLPELESKKKIPLVKAALM